MAKFTAAVDLNIRLPGGFEAVGVSGTTHRIPDSLVDEFVRDVVPSIAGGVVWVTQDETSSVSGFDPSTKYDKAGGTISGAVTVTGALLAQSSVSTPALTATAARFKGGPWHDVKAYGAVGDDTADDTSAIQAAISAATSGIIFFPPGTYKITSPLSITTPVHLMGAYGREAPSSVIRQATASAIGISATSAAQPLLLSQLAIYGAATTATTSADGISAAKDAHLDRVTVKGFYNGLHLGSGSFYATIEGSFFFSSVNAGVLVDSGATNVLISDGTRFAYGKYGVYASGSVRGMRVNNATIEQTSQYGVYIDGANASQIAITGIWFETTSALGGAALGYIGVGQASAVKAVSIRDNIFFPTDISSFYDIDVANTTSLTIDGNYFGSTGAGGGPFRLTGTVQDVSIGSNHFQAGISGAVYDSATQLRWFTGGEHYNQLSSATGSLLSGRVGGDTSGRFLIDASGKHSWGTGAAVRDTTLERISGPFLSANVAVIAPIIGAQVSATAAISTNNNSTTILSFTAETFDTDTFHESVTNPSRFTIPAAYNGMKARLGANVTFAANSVGFRRVEVLKSGATLVGRESRLAVGGGDVTDVSLTTPWITVATGDYFEVRATQSSGGALNVNSAAAYTPIFWLEIAGT